MLSGLGAMKLPPWPAVMDGMLPATSGGLLITVLPALPALPALPGNILGAKLVIEPALFDLVGEAGRTVAACAAGLGGGNSMLEAGLDGAR